MKLRLPHQFQAALLAAIASVSLTTLSSGTAHGAVTLADTSSWAQYDENTGTATVGNTDTGLQYGTIHEGGQTWNTTWAYVVTVDTASLLDSAKPESILVVGLSQNQGAAKYAEAATLTYSGSTPQITLTTWSHANVKTEQLSATDCKDLTFVITRPSNGQLTLDVYKDGDFSTKMFTATETTGQSFSGTVVTSAGTGSSRGDAKGGSTTLPADDTVGSYAVLGAGYSLGSVASSQDLQTYYNNITVLQWNGTDNSDWSSTAANWLKWGEGEAMAFTVTGAQALFGKGDGLSKIVNVTGDSAVSVSAVKVVDNYTFNMGGNLNAGKITIAEGASLAYTGSGALAGTLSGAGTYILPNGTAALGSVSLGEGWTGAVRVSGVSFSNTNLATTFTRTGSWVELNGITGGYLNGWNNGKEDANIILTNSANGDVAWKWTDGSSNGETLLTLNGDIKGTGTLFKDTNNKRQGFKFTGDVHGWTGDFRTKVTDVNAVTKLEFAGSTGQGDEPYAVNVANITNEGVAALNVIFSTAGNVSVASNIKKTGTGAVNIAVSSGTSATFTGSIANANTLTLDNNADATFKGTTNITNGVTLGSGASLTNTGDMTLDGTIAFGDNPILNNGSGAITLGNSVKFNLNGMTPDANNKYTLFSGTGQSVDLSGYDETYLILQGGTAGKEWHFGNDGTISFSGVSNKVWSGNDFYWNHTSTTAWKDGTPFKDGDSVRFDESYVIINENVEASNIQIEERATVIMSTIEGCSLSAASLVIGNEASVATCAINGLETYTVGTGASWSIDGAQTLKAGGVNNGTIVVASTASVILEGTTIAASMSGFQNNGTLSIALADATGGNDNIVTMATTSTSNGTLEVRSGTIDYRSKLQSQTLRLGNGARLLFGETNGSDAYSGAIEVAGNASVRTHGTSKHAHVTISGAVSGAQGTLTREDDGNQDLNFTGNVNLGSFVNNDQQPNSLTNFQGPTELGSLIAGNKSKTVFSGGATIGSMTLKGSAAVEIASATSVTSLLDLSNGQESQQRTTGTLSVKDGGVLTIGTDASFWGRSNSYLLLENGGILNIAGMKIEGTAVSGGATGISTTSDNAKYGIASTEWTISDAAVTATQEITIGNVLSNSSIATGGNAVTLNNAANVLAGATVGEGGTLNINAAAELKSAITNSGTVVFSHDITATGLAVTTSNFNVGLNGQEISTDVTNANYFAGGQKDSITVVNGGTVNPNNHKVVQNDVDYTLGADGKAVHTVKDVEYGTFYQHEAGSTLTLSAINAAAVGQMFGVGKVDVQGANLAIDAMCWDVVAYNARLVVEDSEYVIAAHIAGGTNNVIVQGAEALDLPKIMFNQSEAAKVVNLKHADGSDYTVTDNTNASVRITSLGDDEVRNGQVTITAAANAPQSYAVSSDAFDVNATKLEKIADSRVQVSNTLNVKEIHNDAAGKTGDFVLTKGVDAAALDTVIATSGNIEFQNMSETEQANLNTLNIGEGMTVSMYTGSVAEAAQEASVTVSGTLTAGAGATLNAGLNMASGSHLDVSGAQDTMGLIMGSPVTLHSGSYLDIAGVGQDEVSGYLYNYLSSGTHELYYLYSGTEADKINLTINGTQQINPLTKRSWYDYDMDAHDIYANLQSQTFYMVYDGSNVGTIVAIGLIPEPTTSTLSLLALCALAARRRRKG